MTRPQTWDWAESFAAETGDEVGRDGGQEVADEMRANRIAPIADQRSRTRWPEPPDTGNCRTADSAAQRAGAGSPRDVGGVSRMTVSEQITPVEHRPYEVETPFKPVHEVIVPAQPPAAATTWTGTAEQVAFRERVLQQHLTVARARRGAPGRDLEPGERATVGATAITMRRDAAEAAGRLIAAANEALARAKLVGDADAMRTRSITATSGYRSSQKQASTWRGNFGGYYNRTAAHRAGLDGGPHGTEASQCQAPGLVESLLSGFQGCGGRVGHRV